MSAIPGLNTAILDFCTRLDDGPKDEAAARREIPQRDPADYAWLREALASIEQPETKLKRLLETLDQDATAAAEPAAEAVEALEEVQDMVEDLNLATEFDLMGGPGRVLALLRRASVENKGSAAVRRIAAMIVGASSQNHERLQAKYVAENFQDVLIPMMSAETDAGARAALVFAVSNVCRAHGPAAAAFLKAGGLGMLLAVTAAHATTDAKSTGRCLRLIAYFAEECGTTAAPVAEATCQLATSTSSDVSEEVSEAAAAASVRILKRCIAAGANDMLTAMVNWLAPWAAAASGAETARSDEHKALLVAFKVAVMKAGTPSNKAAPAAAVDTSGTQPAAAAAAAPAAAPLGLPAPKA